MEQKQIPILGLASYQGSGAGKDGDCLDALNVHMVNGVLKPSCPPLAHKQLQSHLADFDTRCFRRFYFHNKSGRFIAVYDDGRAPRCMMFDSEFRNVTPYREEDETRIPWNPSGEDILSINFVGYIMIVTYPSAMHYWIFQQGRYKYLGTKPPMPMLKIAVHRKIFRHAYEISYSDRSYNDPSSENYLPYRAKGIFDACVKKGNEEAYYIDRTLVRYALRLADGSYIMHSGLFLIEDDATFSQQVSGETDIVFDTSNMKTYLTESDGRKYKCGVKMFKPVFEMEVSPELQEWRDLVVSVDVFTTGSIRSEKETKGFSTTSTPTYQNPFPNYEIQDKKLSEAKISSYGIDNDLRAKILAKSTFYKVASFSLEGKLNEESVLEDVSDENLSVQDRLTDDAFTHNTFVSDAPYVYNNRLHIANCREFLFQGYDSRQFIEYGFWEAETNTGEHDLIPKPSDATDIHIFVRLKTDEGERVVHRHEEKGFIPHARMLTYPDARAYQMIIQYTQDGQMYQLKYPLTKHNKLNMSYYLNPLTVLYAPDGHRYDRKNSISIDSGIKPESITSNQYGKIQVADTLNRTNVLKVSNVDNPFFFPARNTYTVGNGSIIGLSTVVGELSTGRLGAFPLYVFTTEGVFSMEVDASGQLAYTRTASLSEHVCTAKQSITAVRGGVAFVTGQGVMMISGNSVQNLTERIRFGKNMDLLQSLPSNGRVPADSLLRQIYSVMKLEAPDASVQKYVSEPVNVAYLYRNNELILSNPIHDYSYLLCLDSGFWYRINKSFSNFIEAYPEVYGQDKENVYLIDRTDTNSFNSFLILSSPMALDTTSHKKVLQSVLRCDLFTNDKVGFYVLGSNDGQKFRLIAPKELVHVPEKQRPRTHQVDMVTRALRSNSFKFVAFAVTGGAYTDSIINHVGMLVEPSFTNKLR